MTTALVVAYPVLIAASGLWRESRLVWLTTALSIAGYLLLAADAFRRGAGPPAYELLHVVTSMAAAGVVVAYQIRRWRALRRLAERRPSL